MVLFDTNVVLVSNDGFKFVSCISYEGNMNFIIFLIYIIFFNYLINFIEFNSSEPIKFVAHSHLIDTVGISFDMSLISKKILAYLVTSAFVLSQAEVFFNLK
jgi:hypothetical protein